MCKKCDKRCVNKECDRANGTCVMCDHQADTVIKGCEHIKLKGTKPPKKLPLPKNNITLKGIEPPKNNITLMEIKATKTNDRIMNVKG